MWLAAKNVESEYFFSALRNLLYYDCSEFLVGYSEGDVDVKIELPIDDVGVIVHIYSRYHATETRVIRDNRSMFQLLEYLGMEDVNNEIIINAVTKLLNQDIDDAIVAMAAARSK